MLALRIAELVTALLVLGEAAALVFGMGLITPPAAPWVTTPNLLLLLSDVLFGGLITYSAVSSRETDNLVVVAAAALIATHAYRAVEYFLGGPNPFCANLGLFLMNDLKLVAGIVVIVLVFRARR